MIRIEIGQIELFMALSTIDLDHTFFIYKSKEYYFKSLFN